MANIGICPECSAGEFTELCIESSREMRQSKIFCSECDFKFHGNCDEVTLIRKFKKEYPDVTRNQ